MYGSAADAKLDAMYEARERDPLPDETPPTDEEMQEMAEFFANNVETVINAVFPPKAPVDER